MLLYQKMLREKTRAVGRSSLFRQLHAPGAVEKVLQTYFI
jgi:hypothetical protein